MPTSASLIPVGREAPATFGRYYRRTGQCTECGQCCTNIYLIQAGEPVKTLEAFQALQKFNSDYAFFKPIDETETGLLFHCTRLGEDNRCTRYDDRPGFCRNYPDEHIPMRGGVLPEECGYVFELRKPFREILEQTARKKPSWVERVRNALPWVTSEQTPPVVP
jgi:Fe-S-cluster containining protein